MTRLGDLETGECLGNCRIVLPGVIFLLFWKANASSRHRLVSFLQGAGCIDAQLLFDEGLQGQFAILRNIRFASQSGPNEL